MPLRSRKWKARRLPDSADRSGWFETLPPPPEPRRVDRSVRADWAVIGAGVCGLAAARRLGELRPDDTVAVVEATRVGWGTSGRNAGFMLAHHSHGGIANMEIGRRADRLFQAGYTWLRETVERHQIRCDWSEWGQVYVSAGQEGRDHLDGVADGFAGLGVAHEHIDREALEHITGTRFYEAGVRLKGGSLVQPAAMMRGLGATLPATVTLYEESPVTELHHDSDGFRLTCPRGEVVADRVILANHVFAEDMGFARARVVPIATYASLTRPLTEAERAHVGAEGEFGLLPANPSGSTVRLTRDHRVLMRNTHRYVRDKRFDAATMPEIEARHQASIARRWPALAGIDLVSTWGGITAATRNEGMVWGELRDSLYAVLTTDTAPMTRGTAAAKLLVEDLCGIDSDELRMLKAMPGAAILPPDPILRFVAERRIRRMESRSVGER